MGFPAGMDTVIILTAAACGSLHFASFTYRRLLNSEFLHSRREYLKNMYLCAPKRSIRDLSEQL